MSVATHLSPVCSICSMSEGVLPCQTCHRFQCESCILSSSNQKECQGCHLDHLLLYPEYSFEDGFPALSLEEEEKEEPGYTTISDPNTNSIPLQYVVESGLSVVHPPWLPSEEEWTRAHQILESHILFATRSPPVLYMKYIIGRVYHHRTCQTTEYIMAYEPSSSHSGCQWNRYVVTFYLFSPVPWERDLFCPYPLPLTSS